MNCRLDIVEMVSEVTIPPSESKGFVSLDFFPQGKWTRLLTNLELAIGIQIQYKVSVEKFQGYIVTNIRTFSLFTYGKAFMSSSV